MEFDEVLEEKAFGKYQNVMVFALIWTDAFVGLSSLMTVFISAKPLYHCEVNVVFLWNSEVNCHREKHDQ